MLILGSKVAYFGTIVFNRDLMVSIRIFAVQQIFQSGFHVDQEFHRLARSLVYDCGRLCQLSYPYCHPRSEGEVLLTMTGSSAMDDFLALCDDA